MVSYICNALFFHGAASWIRIQSSNVIWISTVIMNGRLHKRRQFVLLLVESLIYTLKNMSFYMKSVRNNDIGVWIQIKYKSVKNMVLIFPTWQVVIKASRNLKTLATIIGLQL